MTHPLPPGPWHTHGCACYHCDAWRRHLRQKEPKTHTVTAGRCTCGWSVG